MRCALRGPQGRDSPRGPGPSRPPPPQGGLRWARPGCAGHTLLLPRLSPGPAREQRPWEPEARVLGAARPPRPAPPDRLRLPRAFPATLPARRGRFAMTLPFRARADSGRSQVPHGPPSSPCRRRRSQPPRLRPGAERRHRARGLSAVRAQAALRCERPPCAPLQVRPGPAAPRLVFLRLWGNTDALQSARSALARGDSPRVHAQVRSGAPTAQAGTGALVPPRPHVPTAATRAPLARSSSRRGQCHAEEREGGGREKHRKTGKIKKRESEGQGEGGKGREEGPRLGSEALACPVPGARCPVPGRAALGPPTQPRRCPPGASGRGARSVSSRKFL